MQTDNKPTRFALVGSGWRSEFFLRIARALPDRFEVCGVVIRDADKGSAVEQTWNVRTFRSIADLVKSCDPEFVVVSVAHAAAPGVIGEIVSLGLPVLTETPPSDSIESMEALNRLTATGAKIQVAEQYHLQPLINAQISIARSGRLGDVDQAQVSLTQGYHGMSIIRRLLGIGAENAVIRASDFRSPFVMGPSRTGDPEQEQITTDPQTIASLDFGDKFAVFDFSSSQHRSWVRSGRLLVRGPRGEINNTEVRYLEDYLTPIQYSIRRVDAGEDTNLEGHFLRGLLAGDSWVYRNEFIPARLMDDEIAVAACLAKMSEYARGGEGFYSLAEASQDQYLQLMIRRAVDSGESVTTVEQSWAESI